MKTKLSYKDLLLVVGIVVAVIIALTTWVYTESQPESSKINTPATKKSSLIVNPSTAIKKFLEKSIVSASAQKPSASR